MLASLATPQAAQSGPTFATPLPVSAISVQGTAANTRVYVRTRPLLPQELSAGAKNVLKFCSANKQVIIEDGGSKVFRFDGVLPEDCSQEEVFMQAVQPLVREVEEGRNAAVFAYGQTGSGKTYTMGTHPILAKEDEGILQRAVRALLTDVGGQPRSLSLSMVEIYNEVPYDLLTNTRTPLSTRPSPGGGLLPVDMVEEPVSSVDQCISLLEEGSQHRSVGTTAANEHSSRSHALIYLTLKEGRQQGCLRLVDLAGAEGVGRAQTTGMQLTEGININKGLLALGKVMAALSNPSSSFVSYRESVLTRLLKDSLGGECHTVMIACVNPALVNMYQTTSTLNYAEQARHIKIKPRVMSTVKRQGRKRRSDDVSATPDALKKHLLDPKRKTEHNSTISTPGYKPKRPRLHPLSNTFTTPANRMSEAFSQSTHKTQGLVLPLPQPLFEDDSPSRLSTISPIHEDTKPPQLEFSPLVSRVTSYLEKTMISQLERMGDRLADTVVSKLTQKKNVSHSKRLMKTPKIQEKSRTSTPSSESDSSSDNLLGKSIVAAFFGKKGVKSMLQDMGLNLFDNPTGDGHIAKTEQKKFAAKKTEENRKPLGDVTNALLHHHEVSKVEKEEEEEADAAFVFGLPITSTAVVDRRSVRNSTRLSTRRSIHTALSRRLTHELQSLHSPGTDSHCNKSWTEQPCEVTVMPAPDSTPYSRPPTQPQRGHTAATHQDMASIDTDDITHSEISCVDVSLSTLEVGKSTRRRSSRLAALNATQLNMTLLQAESPVYNKKRRSTYRPRANQSVCVQPKLVVGSQDGAGGQRTLTVDPVLQQQHNASILAILNQGNLKKLQQLPTVGPKTAMVIYNFRNLYGEFKCVEDLKNIEGLHKNFCTRFMKANVMSQINP